jgi:hypothetical protein
MILETWKPGSCPGRNSKNSVKCYIYYIKSLQRALFHNFFAELRPDASSLPVRAAGRPGRPGAGEYMRACRIYGSPTCMCARTWLRARTCTWRLRMARVCVRACVHDDERADACGRASTRLNMLCFWVCTRTRAQFASACACACTLSIPCSLAVRHYQLRTHQP